jgi:uncharacterized membrane protein
MTKNEFLEGLQDVLAGELPSAEVENNIKFYKDYINTKSVDLDEEYVLEQLGDPRLIAKTIIETYQISHGPMYNSNKGSGGYQDDYSAEKNYYDDNTRNQNYGDPSNSKYSRNHGFQIHSTLTWYQKLFLIIISVVVIVLIVLIGGIIIQLFFSIGFPLLIIYIGYRLIRNSTRR